MKRRKDININDIDVNDVNTLLDLFSSDNDCESLKDYALDYVKSIGGKKWSDYAPHDPGITMLEELCYAITDIDYRLDFEMEDLIADNPKEKNDITYFHKPEEIFPCSPITITDYKQLILDVPGVRNCRIVPIKEKGKVKGLYDIYLYIEFDDEKEKEQIMEHVSELLNQNRNIGEDFNEIKLFNIVDVDVDLVVELDENCEKDKSFSYDNYAAELLSDIQDIFIPYNPFLSLSETYTRTKNLEYIFNGPTLNCGFLDNASIDKYSLKTEYLIFNIINILSKKKGIKKVKFLEIKDTRTNEVFKNQINLRQDQVVRIIFKKSNVSFIDRNRKISTNESIVTTLAKRVNMFHTISRKKNDEEFDFYKGTYKDLSQFYSTQNGLPSIYGTSEEGARKENDNTDNIFQLKGFLLFFDIYLAQYLQWIDALKHTLSISSSHDCSKDFKFPDNIADLNKILKRPSNIDRNINFPDRAFSIQKFFIVRDDIEVDPNENKNLIDSCTNYINKILDRFANKGKRTNVVYHLLSRYGAGGDIVNNNYVDPSELLVKFPSISQNRAKAAFFTRNDEIFESKNISSFEYKFCCYFHVKDSNRRLLHSSFLDNFTLWNGFKKQQQQQGKIGGDSVIFNGKFTNIFYLVLKYGENIDNYLISNINDIKTFEIKLFIDNNKTKYISLSFKGKDENYDVQKIQALIEQISSKIRTYNVNTEGIHCIEHILLRTSNTLHGDDVFSNQITILFPDWPSRFQDKVFRLNVQEWIEKELPVHIKANILWLNIEDMKTVEYNYKHWLSVKKSSSYDKEKVDSAAEALLEVLLKFKREQK